MNRKCFCMLLVLVSWLAAGWFGVPVAHAEPAQDHADALFAEGKAAAQAKNWKQAYQLLSEAWQRKQSYDIASNLGQVAYLLGKPVEAAQRVAFALNHYPPTGDVEQKRKMQSLLELVRKDVASVQLQVSPRDAEVSVDGNRSGLANELPPELFLEPGERTLAATRGRETVERRISAKPGGRYRVELDLAALNSLVPGNSSAGPPADAASSESAESAPAPSAQQPHAQPEDTAPSSGGQLQPKWIVVIAGAGLTLVSGAALSIYSVKRSRAEADVLTHRARAASPDNPNPCVPGSSNRDCQALAESIEDWQHTGRARNVSLAATIGLGVATLVSYLLWPEADADAEVEALTSGARAARLSPLVTPDQRGFTLSGSF